MPQEGDFTIDKFTVYKHEAPDPAASKAVTASAATHASFGFALAHLADNTRLEELRKVEAIEQLHLIVAAYGEPLVLRWVKSVAAMQSGTAGT